MEILVSALRTPFGNLWKRKVTKGLQQVSARISQKIPVKSQKSDKTNAFQNISPFSDIIDKSFKLMAP